MKVKQFFALLLTLVLLLSAIGCSTNSSTGAGKNDTLIIYEGQFSEMWLVHSIVKQLVEAKTDLKVVIRDQMAPVNSYKEILRGNADLMNSYDGTLLTTYLHLDPADVPEGTSLYDYANEQAKSEGVRLLGKLGLNNTYAIGVPQEIAQRYHLKTYSDLAAVSDQLVFAAEHDFFTEEGSAKFNPLCEFYGFRFKQANQIDMSLKYSAIENGNIDVTIVYSTDGLNKKAGLTILEDERNFFPEYNGAILVRSDIFEKFKEKAPNLEEVLELLTGQFSSEEMVDMSYAVDVEGRPADEVAKEALVSRGLLEG